ncbi:MAG TPA: hypothetical protein VNK41_06830 [Vicinamibacterales bacterium]|nr:hypothetical protein [Vicinamibacterales bacterium]
MVTNLQDVLTGSLTATSSLRGWWSRALDHLQSAVCGLHGHDPILQFEEGRMFLRCTSCGFETPGWDTGDRRPRLRFEGDVRRHQLVEPSTARRRSAA